MDMQKNMETLKHYILFQYFVETHIPQDRILQGRLPRRFTKAHKQEILCFLCCNMSKPLHYFVLVLQYQTPVKLQDYHGLIIVKSLDITYSSK